MGHKGPKISQKLKAGFVILSSLMSAQLRLGIYPRHQGDCVNVDMHMLSGSDRLRTISLGLIQQEHMAAHTSALAPYI